MSDKPETLSAILAEIRDFCSGWSEDVDVTVKVGLIYGWMCRIEAAAERERAALDAARKVAKDTAEQYRKLYEKKKEADNQLAELEERYPIVLEQSNAAAMRELLEKIRHEYGWGRIGCRTCVSSEADVERVSDLFEKRIDAALAAPARNCDRFNNATEAGLAYRNLVLARAGRVVDIDENTFFAHLANWLFAPAEGGAE